MKKIMFNDKYGLTQAVLDGRKTQTRRIITYPKKYKGIDVRGFFAYRRMSDNAIVELCMYDEDESSIDEGQIVPKYKVGEIVAIAQSYRNCDGFCKNGMPRWDEIAISVGAVSAGWDNKMFVRPEYMPHQIRITNVRIEQLQDISDEDCLAEGIIKWDAGQKDIPFFSYPNSAKCDYDTPQEAFANLINKVSKKDVWENNPYVFVYDFKLIK